MQRYLVYSIFSEKLHKIYIGQTADLQKRLTNHKRGYSSYTSRTDDWELFYQEEFSTRAQAIRREKELKTSRGRAFLWEYLEKCKPQVNGPSADPSGRRTGGSVS